MRPGDFQWQTRSPLLDVAVFGGLALGGVVGVRRPQASPRETRATSSSAPMPRPTPRSAVTSSALPAFALVSAAGSDFMVNVTPAMTGQVVVDGRTVPLAEWVRQRGPSFSLGERDLATIDCGHARFVVAATAAPKPIPVPLLGWRWAEHGYHVGTSAALLLFLLMVFSVPPRSEVVVAGYVQRRCPLRAHPAQARRSRRRRRSPIGSGSPAPEEAGGKGQRHQGDEGKMGNKKSKNKEGLYAIKGAEGQPRAVPGQATGRREREELGYPRCLAHRRGLTHRLDLRSHDCGGGGCREHPRRFGRQSDRRGLRGRRTRRGRRGPRWRRRRAGDPRARHLRHAGEGRRWRTEFRVRPRHG